MVDIEHDYSQYDCLFAVQTVGFVWGYLCQQFSQTILILLAGFLLACLVCTFIVHSQHSFVIGLQSFDTVVCPVYVKTFPAMSRENLWC